jgi:SAM-dependent methyltransferase
MSLRADRREWDDLAQQDAMWGVYSNPGRRKSWTEEEFFATGEQEIAAMVAGLEDQRLMPRAGRALDFGCGLGRLTRALSSRFEEVVGIDHSRAMIGRAERLNAHAANCSFALNARADLAQLPTASFDLVLSVITLQHVSRRTAIRRYIRELARVTAPGGVIVFQLPVSVGWQVRLHPLRLLNRALRALPVAPRWALRPLMGHSMRLMSLPEEDVRSILSDCGTPIAVAFSDNRVGTDVVPSLTYVARRPHAA